MEAMKSLTPLQNKLHNEANMLIQSKRGSISQMRNSPRLFTVGRITKLTGYGDPRDHLGSQKCLSQKEAKASLERTDMSKVIGILTGHNTLRRHLSIMRIKEDTDCDFCGVPETSEHYLIH